MIKLLFLLLVIFTILILFRYVQRQRQQQTMQEKQVVITFDQQVICLRYPDGELRNVRWADLTRVEIQTTKVGRFTTDALWRLYTRDQKPAATFPHDASGESALLTAMRQRLPDFDNDQLSTALGSTRNQVFTVWRL